MPVAVALGMGPPELTQIGGFAPKIHANDVVLVGLRDLDRLVAFLRENSQSRLVLVGFSDSRGSAPQNSKLSLERAKKISSELSERGVRAVDVEAMGSALPVASNDSENGREKNRRVEVWLR
jgi:phosphate transport system substrate-binding protein